MPVTIAKTAGFCFGVERAVSAVDKLLLNGEKIATLGPIIHNPQIIRAFSKKGAVIINEPSEAPKGYKVVIRSHGVPERVYDELISLGIPYYDATCPYVAKIHKIASDASSKKKTVLIAGDAAHPEVKGIVGFCKAGCHVFSDLDQMERFLADEMSVEKSYILLAQTTFNSLLWKKYTFLVRNVYTNINIFDTICNATMLRQQEAANLAEKSDIMLVVGGRGSGNTARLAEISKECCPAFVIESKDELYHIPYAKSQNIGITAGASTPAFIIKEVAETMSDILNQQDDQSFEEMLEQSLKTINSREKVTAVVTNVSPNEIAVDVGTKQSGYVPLYEFTDDPNANLEELVKVGDELELIVLRVNDVEGTAMLSKKRLDAIAGFEKVVQAEESGEILEGTVVDVVKGGVIAVTNGVRVFIPASHATASKGQELETLLKQPVRFKILETNRQRRRAVGSIRNVLKEQRKELEEKFWKDVEVGKTYKGTVKSLTSYGAFVDLGGIDGMVHISELSWSRVKHPSEVLKVGDMVEVYVKDLDPEAKKISLGYKKTEDNPWEILSREHKAGDVCKAKIISLTAFGAFAQILPGIDGLIHISQISNERIAKPEDVISVGQEVLVKITDIDFDKKRVSLSMRALMEPAEKKPEPEADEAPRSYEAGPDTDVAKIAEAAGVADDAAEKAAGIKEAVAEKAAEVKEAVAEKIAEAAQAVAEKLTEAADALEADEAEEVTVVFTPEEKEETGE